ncbi:PilN domain-containing protein [Pleurocapsa sp. PCC 7319]|uniref:PilN domain-containing protein n=1 Tax=Pleurocapsa sp. PCC 7319 TaxID=118161 RepID=UPI000348F6FA|nr:PilN domain-containing protein [Pleurocapsa sp. PCC 7319]
MYNLDINFLRDRGLDQSTDLSSLAQKKEPTMADKIPIFAGIIVALVAPAIAFGYLQSVKAKTVRVEQEITEIESEIAELGNQNKRIEAANEEIQKAEQETAALVSVFESIKPWAAIMQEVSDRTPAGVLVDSIQQSGSGNGTGINIAGVARSYNDVNDFVLFLQRSPFFSEKQTKLNGANLVEFPVEVENEEDLPDNATLEIPQGIKYTISAQLSNVPSSQLIEEIAQKGSVGVATRLKTLERKGALSK